MDRTTYLVHQVHGAKLAADVGAGVVSTWLMRQGRPGTALLVAHTAAAIASAIVMRRDLLPLAQTRRGRYVLAHMPVAAQALRYAGQIIAWYMAYHHRWFGIALGYLLVLGGWAYGLVAPGFALWHFADAGKSQ
jgi:hypothetical protein